MDKGDVATWLAVAVALIAAVIALGNANSAKRQASAAEKAVLHAERSAKAAEDQAAAAREQVELTRRQLHLDEEDRKDQEAPQFKIEWWPDPDDSWGIVKDFTLTYVSGPPVLAELELCLPADSDIKAFLAMKWTEDDNGELVATHESPPLRSTLTYAQVTRGTSRRFRAQLKRGAISVTIATKASTGTDSWPPTPAVMVARTRW
ncbi:hypothetical protein [Lentzea nigeriaca]|uniref:hypothetical protein n=1 Tax=Lentzea nigeriaca TaxID=1128665 RepID=UPI00195D3AE9|nr:hypothetical protein [Lentzea nigeriaca]MBM7861801.1 type II secretory pathway pseudopilin PulG [Lentzea nigeriaca]